jgi:Fe-S cluster biogenesis protein NfuA
MLKDQLPECVARIDELLHKIETLPDAAVREDLQEVVQCLLDYHGAALAQLLSLLPTATGTPQALLQALAEDELVGSLLVLHGLHPADLEARVLAALEEVRPFLESHGGNVELTQLVDGVVHLRLQGSCHGCPSSQATLKQRIEQSILQAAPEIERIMVDDAPAPLAVPNGFVGLDNLTAR